MKSSKEITVNTRRENANMNAQLYLPESFPRLDQIKEITLEDDDGKCYVYRLMQIIPEPASETLDNTIGCENLSIDLWNINDIFKILTDDQRNIVMHIYYLYKNNIKNVKQNDFGEVCEYNPKIILQGPAGTGKSTVINLIEKLITWEENKTSDSPQKIKVLKCAFTGKAASNIDGVTLHHMFSIPIYNTRSLAKKRLASKQELLKSCKFFICDEISMVGEKLMAAVNMRLQAIFDNNKLYGDRFVLLVGDLFQIDPVSQKSIYPDSPLWTCCEFYELTKVIRQQDEKFINALNNFINCEITDEEIDLLRSREIHDISRVPDSVIHLFYENKLVDEFNIKKINKSNGRYEIVNAIDDSEDWVPANLCVKIGIRYMITKNLDVGDGLANGTTGIVKDFDYDKEGCVRAIWMDFHSNVTGKKARSHYLKKHSRPDCENWVPIQRSAMVVKLKSDPKVSRTFRNMFPMRAAEAITVHKSQGQTYHDGVCIHITDQPTDKLRSVQNLQYVALTRVKQLEDLYIIGKLNFSVNKRKTFLKKKNEINRLRTDRRLKLAFETFEDKTGDVIIFLNTGSTFNEHYEFITTDKWYGNGSLLIFTETSTIESDIIDIPNFEIVYRSDDRTAVKSGGGIICYKEANKSVKVIRSVKNDDDNIYLTLLFYENFLYIITGVKGNVNDDDFKCAIDKLMSQYIRDERCIFLIGNYNMEPSETPSLKKKLSCDTSDDSSFDVVFTRNFDIQQDRIGNYEYIPSSHKPIYVKLPPKSELMKNQNDVYSADYEKPGSSQQYSVQETMEVD